ncbi:MAG: hypothetical protein RJA99_2887 [Pseudomonadota bacterium]|jgi:UDP-N-acetylglucosamine 2-epimerase (non-hydrolysing)
MIVDIVAGARPNFVKIAAILAEMARRREQGGPLRPRLVHTGQHYDARMSGSFFEQLGLPDPDVNLEAGSGTQAEQAAAIMVRYERLLLERRSAMCVVVGDVTSTMACAIAARKLGVPVAHVEAGIRSGDRTMPEEINRLVTDSISDWFFTTSETANETLRREGAPPERIHFVGNTMIDTLLANLDRSRPAAFWDPLALQPGGYVVTTLHRPSNVDDPANLMRMLRAIADATRGRTVVFPVHPRTARSLQALGPLPDTVRPVEPQPYLEFVHLIRHALAVVTDSGGVTEETTVLGVPCMTLRDTTERPETVTIGTNALLGTDPAAIRPAMDRLFEGRWPRGGVPPLWDGRSGARIVAALETVLWPPRRSRRSAAARMPMTTP